MITGMLVASDREILVGEPAAVALGKAVWDVHEVSSERSKTSYCGLKHRSFVNIEAQS
jgi:hypothetical protein